MVSARGRNASTYDVWLTHSASGSAVQQGFILADDPETGLLAYRVGLVPLIAPQQFSAGFSLTHLPAQFDLAITFTDWSGGGNWVSVDADAGSSVTKYRDSTGVNPAHEHALYTPPAATTRSSTDWTVEVRDWLGSIEHGLFAIDDTTLREMTTAPSTWTNRQTSSTNSEYSDLMEFTNSTDTYLLAAQGFGTTPALYRVSTDGTTFTLASGTNAPAAAFFAERPDAAGAATVWAVTRDGAINSTTTPTATGAWSAADQITAAGESVRAFVIGADGNFYVFTERRIYQYDGTNSSVYAELNHITANIGYYGQAVLHPNGNIYYAHSRELLQVDTANSVVTTIWPFSFDQFTAGPLSGLAIHGESLLFNATHGSNSHWLYSPRRGVFHQVFGGTLADKSATFVARDGATYGSVAFTSTAERFYRAATNSLYSYDLADIGQTPADTSGYGYRTTGAALNIVGPFVDFGAPTLPKFLRSAEIVAENISSTKQAILSVATRDAPNTWTTVLTCNSSGQTLFTADAPSEIEFTALRYRLGIDNEQANDPPIVHSITLHAAPNFPRKRVWEFDVLLGTAQRGGGASRYSPDNQESFLFSALTERCTFGARDGTAYTARVHNLEYAGVRRYQGRDHPVIRVSIVEL